MWILLYKVTSTKHASFTVYSGEIQEMNATTQARFQVQEGEYV